MLHRANAGAVSEIPLDLLNGIGVVGLCVLAVMSFARGWICSGRELRAIEKQRDDWRSIALRSLNVNERNVAATEVASDALAALPRAFEDHHD